MSIALDNGQRDPAAVRLGESPVDLPILESSAKVGSIDVNVYVLKREHGSAQGAPSLICGFLDAECEGGIQATFVRSQNDFCEHLVLLDEFRFDVDAECSHVPPLTDGGDGISIIMGEGSAKPIG